MADSVFFTSNSNSGHIGGLEPELIHESICGWSAVYRIDRDGRFRVLKALKEKYRGDAQYETLLRKEYEIGYALSHPGICEVYGFLDVQGIGHCIEMEWVNGVPLDVFLSGRNISRELSAKIIRELCDAISYCHSCQIVHRDIKPDNVMITHNGHNVKLIDFGLSDSDSHSVFKSACGTVDFAAPEIICGGQPNILSDIYSIGKMISLLHPCFSSVASKCTKEDPEKRYPDAESVKEAVLAKKGSHRFAYVALAFALVITAGLYRFVVWEPSAYEEEQLPMELLLPDTQTVIAPEPVSAPSGGAAAVVAAAAESSSLERGDTTAIDELFKMATELLENGQ